LSLEFLNSKISAAMAVAKAPHRRAEGNPFDMMSSPGTQFGADMDFGSGQHPEQLARYRGRFYSGANIIVKRVAQQPVYAARTTTDPENSLASMVRSGAIRDSAIPLWAGPPESLELLPYHPAQRAMMDPNSLMTQYNFCEMYTASVLATGRGFVVAVRSDRPGRAYDLFPIPTTWMTPINEGTLHATWEVLPPGNPGPPMILQDRQVAQFYFADPCNPAKALSPIAMVSRAVMSDDAISSAQYHEFRNGALPRLALIAGDVMNETGFMDDGTSGGGKTVRLDPQQRHQILTWFQQWYAGPAKAGLPLILDAIIRDVKQLSRTPREMSFLESAALTKEQIYESLGVSKILTGSLEGTNRASGGLAEQFLVDNTLNPLITMISQALTKKIAPLFAVGDERLVLWISPAEPRDSEVELEWWRLGVRAYAIQRNDIRVKLGLPRLDGMDDVMIPQVMEEREPDEDRVGIGRMPFLNQPEPQDTQEAEKRLLSRINGLEDRLAHESNGRH
jgi:HK97 family phage portal protein